MAECVHSENHNYDSFEFKYASLYEEVCSVPQAHISLHYKCYNAQHAVSINTCVHVGTHTREQRA